MNELNPLLQSSADPTQISARVTGFVISLSSLITFFSAAALHVTVVPDQITALATGLGMVAGAIWFVYGWIRWALVKMSNTAKRSTPID